MRRGHELGSKERGWTWPSAQWVRDTEQWLAVERKLPGLLSGELKPVDGREALLAGKLCDSQKKRFGAAARFYAAAFAADRKLAEDLQAGNRYKAACTAALASAGEGSDADELDADRRRELRQQALDWLRAELDAWSSSIRWNPLSFRSAAETLSHWLTSPDLSAVRDEVSLAELSPDEQLAWKQLWSDVEALRKRVTR
jgi:hypothetical protein